MSATVSTSTFVDWLRERPDDELAVLLSARPDLLHPVPADVAVLAARAASRASVEIALDRLDLGALQLLEALALLAEPRSTSDVARLLQVGPSEIEPGLATLRSAALVWGTDDDLRLLPVLADLVPFPAELGPPARLALTEVPPARLPALLADLGDLLGTAVMGAALTADGEPVTAAEALASIAAIFEDDDRLAALLAAVPDKPREVIELLAAGPPIGRTAGARRAVDAATADTPLRWLLAHAILVPLDDYTVVLPREVGLALRSGQPFSRLTLVRPPLDGPRDPRHSASDVDATAAGQAFATVRLVESLLEKWGVDPPGVLRAGGLGVRELRRTARELDIDERQAALLVELAHAAALVAPDGEVGESWLPTVGYDAWLLKPIADRWLALAAPWLTTTRVPGLIGRREPSELAGPAAARSTSAPNALGPDVDRALAPIVRRDLLRLLRDVPVGTAPSTEALQAVLAWATPRRGGRLRDDLAAWSREEAEYIGFTGRGALSSFGRLLAASLFADRDDPDGDGNRAAEAADALEPLLPKPLDHVLLQADLTAIAPGPLESDLGRELGLVADVESTGGATVYRFSAESIRRGLDAGRSAADIHALLAEKSRTPVPQPLSYLVDDVARRHGRVRIGAASAYIRCDDDTALSEVLADRRADSLRLHRLAPTVLVSPLPPERVAHRLRELGYAPAAEDPEGGLLLRRPDARRAPARPRATRPRGELAAPSAATVAVAVRAIRGGDRAALAAHRGGLESAASASGALPRSASTETLTMLHQAVATGSALLIGYLNAQGQASNRVVEPLRLAGGYLTAFDHRRDEVRTFAVHRITGVATIPTAAGAAEQGGADEAI